MRNMLQFVARLLCVAAFLCLGSGGVWAQAVGWDVWNGTDKTQPAGWQAGYTTLTISSAAELAWLAETVNTGAITGSTGETGFEGCTITLNTNIDLNNHNWKPIGEQRDFRGSFDGNGKTISNLKIVYVDNYDRAIGLFGNLSGATIKKLTVTISDEGINDGICAGGIAGVVTSSTTITNCSVLGGPIKSSYNENVSIYAGGIVGNIIGNNVTISYCSVNVSSINCTFTGNHSRASSFVGGIVGGSENIDAASINNCLSFTTNMISSIKTSSLGSVFGYLNNPTLSNNYFNPLCVFTINATTSIPTSEGADSDNGAALTTENYNSTTVLAGWEEQGWTLKEGFLPKISNSVPDIPLDISIPGLGTERDPYLISSVAGFKYIAALVNSGTESYNDKFIRLENDLDLSNNVWTPIGTRNLFKGTFDGNNKTITLGIKADANQSQAGLFGMIDKGAKVEKLAVCVTSDGITATASAALSNAGAIAAINSGTINQCYVTGGGFLSANGNKSYAGGIAGINGGTISNCYNLIPVKVDEGATAYAGGIVGHNTGTVEKCFASGDVSTAAQTHTTEAAGGIVGFNDNTGSGKITNCVAVNSKVLVNTGSNAHRVIGTGGDENDVNNFSHHEMSLVTKATNNYDPLEGTALTKDNANSATGGCFDGWDAAAWNLDAIGTSLPKLKGFDGQKDISIASYLLYTVTINSVSNGTLTVTRPDPLNTGSSPITVNNGDQIPYNSELTITATPSDNTYELKALTVNSSNFTNGNIHTVTDNVTVSATIEKIPEYTVTINPPSNGTISITYTDPTGAKITVNNGEKVMRDTELTITATPSDNTYELKTLTVNSSNFTNGSTHKVAGDVTVSATIEKIPKYTVTINPPSNGTISITHPDPLNSTGTITVNNGDNVMRDIELTIKATPASGYKLKTLTVNGGNFTNGATHKVADNVTVSATFEAESVDPGPIDPDPTPTPPQPTVYYTVTLPSVEGVATDPVAGEHEVESWSNFRFSLTLDSAYNQSVPVVTTDRGETLTPRQSDGAYILNQVRSDVEIYISGIVKNPDPVANEAIKATAAKVWITNNHLHLQSPVEADAYIYTAAGNQQAICHLTAGQQETIQLPAGIYFVRIGNERFKVRL